MRRMAFSYGCVMIRLPQHLDAEIRGYAAVVPDTLLVKTEDAGSGIPDEIHVTVKYGLLTTDANEVADAIVGTEPIIVTLGRVGIFHNEKNAVLKIAVESRGLRALHNRVCSQIEHVNTYGDYRPHVTLAYLKKREDDPYYYRVFYSDEFEGRQFEVSRVVFSSVDGCKCIICFDGTIIPLQ